MVAVASEKPVLWIVGEPDASLAAWLKADAIDCEVVSFGAGFGAIAPPSIPSPSVILIHVPSVVDLPARCAQLRQQVGDRPAIIISLTAPDPAQIDMLYRAGMTDYVMTLHPQTLATRVQAHLAQQQQVCYAQRLQRAQHSVQLMLHAVSHDLRIPVLGMQMVLKNLLAGIGCCAQPTSEPDDRIWISRSLLERMVAGSDRHLTLIDALVDAHASEGRSRPLACQPLALDSLVATVAEHCMPQVQKSQAALIQQVPPTLPLVFADSDQIQRLLEHLVGNALKHNPPGVQVMIRAEHHDGAIQCSVIDNGVGISPEQHSQMFQLSCKGPALSHTQGLGLGLYLCQQIVQAHGGTIGLDSTPDAGTIVTFTLPVHPAA
jgi:two-component system sensor histidine kinase/response regulator